MDPSKAGMDLDCEREEKGRAGNGMVRWRQRERETGRGTREIEAQESDDEGDRRF